MLVASDLSFVIPGGRVLFREVNLALQASEIVSITAPSGIGKSTLLSVLGGLLAPSGGQVLIDSNEIRFAWIVQTLNSMSNRTVLDNVCLYRLADGDQIGRARRKAAATLELLGLDDLSKSRARDLSGGELQRLAVARAVASDREIVLADEPTNQLDSRNARRVMECLAAVASTGRSAVIVTHDLDAVPTSARRLQLTESGLTDP